MEEVNQPLPHVDLHTQQLATFAAFVGMGLASWLLTNATYVELGAFLHELPEHYSIYAYSVVALESANVYPLLYMFLNVRPSQGSVIWWILLQGLVVAVLLSFLWSYTVSGHSVAMLVLTHFGGMVSTTSSVVFYPYVASYPPLFTSALSTGEGLSGSVAAVLGLVQDPGGVRRFSVTAFYLICAALMCVSLAAFAFLQWHPWVQQVKESETADQSIQKEQQNPDCEAQERDAEEDSLLTRSSCGSCPSPTTAVKSEKMSKAEVFELVWPLLACQFVLAAFSFGWLPSTMPYVYKKFAPADDVETETARFQTTASIAALILSPLASVATTWMRLYYVRSMTTVLLLLALLLLTFSLTSKPILSNYKSGYLLPLLVHISYLVGTSYTQTMLYLTLKRTGETKHSTNFAQRVYQWNGLATQVGAMLAMDEYWGDDGYDDGDCWLDEDSEDGDQFMDQELESACRTGDFQGIWSAYKDGAKLDIAGEGETPLMVTVDGGQLDVVRFLLGQGVKVDREDGFGLSGGHFKIVKDLVEYGADVKWKDSQGSTLLMLAADGGHLEIVEYLVEHGADVNWTDNQGSTPLILAVKKGKLEIVKVLVENGAYITKVDKDGRTPLWRAITAGHLELVLYLESAGAIPERDPDSTRLMKFCASGNADTRAVRYLVENYDSDVNSRDAKGRTALGFLCASTSGNVNSEVVTVLVENYGADIDAQEQGGVTPLMLAADKGNVQVVARLLRLKADVNLTDNGGRTAFDYAIRSGHWEVDKLLRSFDSQSQVQSSHPSRKALEDMMNILDELYTFAADPQKLQAQACQTAVRVLEDIEVAVRGRSSEINPIQRLSLSRAGELSLVFFRKRTIDLLNALGAPWEAYRKLEDRWDILNTPNAQVFMSEMDKSLMSLHPTNTKDLALLLQQELQNFNYSEAQREIIQIAYESVSSQSEVVESLPKWFIGCQIQPKRLHILVVVQRLKQFAEKSTVQPDPVFLSQPPVDFIQELRQLLRGRSNGDKKVVCAIYDLLLDRLLGLYDGKYQEELKEKLHPIAVSAKEWLSRLQTQPFSVDLVQMAFRGFSLHRQIDRVLAEHFVSIPGVNWEDQCSGFLRGD
ncbi:Ankyrin repeat domain-containing protein 50 [Phytophthora citrophthora]|uniref:Ankyrin repeat domain-containing protein 50 n=1 Tax=Phytophthora citrophthora TaxID=4793 RepID=A0AAD9GBG5_9STRA|nr:Ankyrin repeat domain-containing protein 50 [Phytophthora citrophthora]